MLILKQRELAYLLFLEESLVYLISFRISLLKKNAEMTK